MWLVSPPSGCYFFTIFLRDITSSSWNGLSFICIMSPLLTFIPHCICTRAQRVLFIASMTGSFFAASFTICSFFALQTGYGTSVRWTTRPDVNTQNWAPVRDRRKTDTRKNPWNATLRDATSRIPCVFFGVRPIQSPRRCYDAGENLIYLFA